MSKSGRYSRPKQMSISSREETVSFTALQTLHQRERRPQLRLLSIHGHSVNLSAPNVTKTPAKTMAAARLEFIMSADLSASPADSAERRPGMAWFEWPRVRGAGRETGRGRDGLPDSPDLPGR